MRNKLSTVFWKLFNKNEENLQRIAHHFPDSITPNFLTFLRVLFTIPIVLAIQEENYLIAAIFFFTAYLFDIFDGPLARVKNQVTEFGKLFDPAADKIVFLSVLYILGKELLPSLLIYTIFALELFLVVLTVILKPIADRLGLVTELGSNIYGKIKMFFQTLGIITLFMLLGFERDVLPAIIIFIIAIFFSVLSIFRHILAVQKKTPF